MNRLSLKRSALELRASVLRAVRRFFETHDFLEVETPNRIPCPAPEAHIDPIEADGLFLHTSPELCMKRLLAAGFDRIFQICKAYRKAERGLRHLEEFTLLEWYEAHTDYWAIMARTEALIVFITQEIGFGEFLRYGDRTVKLTRPWQKTTVAEAFARKSSIPVQEALDSGRFDEIIGFEIEPGLGWDRPVFLYDYPASCGALSRLRPDNPKIAERFELYICGIELCNAFTELTDAKEQRRRFEEETTFRQKNNKAIWGLPEPFLRELEDMPPASGNALGLDRLVMLFAGAEKIDDVVAFTPEML
jgi:lysyl-tRNA synthetase class 2